MGRQRREFTPEYKDEAVGLVVNTGRTVATVARELGTNEATLGRWVSMFRTRQHKPVSTKPGQGHMADFAGCSHRGAVPGRRSDLSAPFSWSLARSLDGLVLLGGSWRWDHDGGGLFCPAREMVRREGAGVAQCASGASWWNGRAMRMVTS